MNPFRVCLIIRYYLSCIPSESVKLYTAIHERFGHVSRSSLKRVRPDSALFLMSVYKTSLWQVQRFSASLTAWSFLSANRRITCDVVLSEILLRRGRLHCQLSGFLPNLVFYFGITNCSNSRYWQCMASSWSHCSNWQLSEAHLSSVSKLQTQQ